jgi:hypothetical protein
MPACFLAGRSTCGLDHMRAGASRTFEALERLSGLSDPSRKPSQSFRTPPGQPIGQGAGIRPGDYRNITLLRTFCCATNSPEQPKSHGATTSTRRQAHVRACPPDGTSAILPTPRQRRACVEHRAAASLCRRHPLIAGDRGTQALNLGRQPAQLRIRSTNPSFGHLTAQAAHDQISPPQMYIPPNARNFRLAGESLPAS